jgi:hypothetical protein
MFILDKASSAVLVRCDYDSKKKTRSLRLHLRPDGGALSEEIYVQFTAELCDADSASALREFADAIDKSLSECPQDDDLVFLEAPHDDGLQEERKAVFASINAGFKRLMEIAEIGRTRRVLTGPKTSS